MSNPKLFLRKALSSQGSLFDTEITEGALDVSLIFRDSLSKALTRCKDSRWQAAAKISELTRHNITKDMLDKYTSSNLDYGFRAEGLTAFCAVTGSIEPFRALLAPIKCEVVDPTESKYIKLARLERENARLQEEIARLRVDLGIRKS
jgi:hypothetical protein